MASGRSWWVIGVLAVLVCLALATTMAVLLVMGPKTRESVEPTAGWPDWLTMAKAHVAERPANGLGRLIDAREAFNFIVYATHAPGLERVCERGWREADDELRAHLAEQASLIESLVAFARAEEVDFPPVTDAATPHFDEQVHWAFNQTMRAEIERLRASDDIDQALERSLDLLRLHARFRAVGAPLAYHRMALRGMSSQRRVLSLLLADERLSEATLAAAAEELARIDEMQAPLAEGVRTDAAAAVRTLRRDPETLLGRAVSAEVQAEAMQELGRVQAAVIAEMEKPLWEREIVDQAWLEGLSDNDVVLSVLRSSGRSLAEMSEREGLITAQLRLFQGLCLDRLGREDEIASVIDPFSGEGLQMTKEAIFSVGPDRGSQAAKVLFEFDWESPWDSLVLEGDMAVRRLQ